MIDKIAFKGKKYTIEWFINRNGNSQAFEYFENSTEKEQDKAIALFKFMANIGMIYNIEKFRNEGDGIYAFKISQSRYLCFFFRGGKIIITNAYTKKSTKIPPKEKQKALIAYKDYIKRIQEGTYYEEKN